MQRVIKRASGNTYAAMELMKPGNTSPWPRYACREDGREPRTLRLNPRREMGVMVISSVATVQNLRHKRTRMLQFACFQPRSYLHH